MEVSLWKRITEFSSSTPRWKNLKTQQSPVILDLCLKKTRAGISRDYHKVVAFMKLRLQNVFPSNGNEERVFFCTLTYHIEQ